MDGVNVRDLNVRWLRAQIGYVGQEPVLFAGSIATNVIKGRADTVDIPLRSLPEIMREQSRNDCLPCLMKLDDAGQGPANAANAAKAAAHVPAPINGGRPAAGGIIAQNSDDVEAGQRQRGDTIPAPLDDVPADVVDAAMAANAHTFISDFTEGYHTDVGEQSSMVSGGQKQRIAIARALIKRPAVLLLDEATSALDAASEKVVQASIDALASSKTQTTIIIAHRLTTIVNADKIVVIDGGQVVEEGTHETLLRREGLYAMLWAKQQQTTST